MSPPQIQRYCPHFMAWAMGWSIPRYRYSFLGDSGNYTLKLCRYRLGSALCNEPVCCCCLRLGRRNFLEGEALLP